MSTQATTNSASERSGRRAVVATVGCLAAGAVLIEVLLRVLVPQLGMRRYDQHFTGSQPIEINQRGFRGPLPARDEDTVVLCLGDSTTYGTGTAASDTWPMRLGADRSPPLVGINAGMPGTDLHQLTRSLEENWSDFKPKAVVVAMTGNMVSLAWIRRNEPSSIKPHAAAPPDAPPPSLRQRLKYLASDSPLIGGLIFSAETLGYGVGVNHHRLDPNAPYGALVAQGWTQAGLDPSLADRCWDELASDLRELHSWCEERGIPLVATWIPSRFTISDELRDNLKFVPIDRLSIDANDRCRRMCDEMAIPFADSLEAMKLRRLASEQAGRDAPLYIMGDYTHLDAEGHAAVADAIRTALSATPVTRPDGTS
jgi:lysophospholipase L1-like esterase